MTFLLNPCIYLALRAFLRHQIVFSDWQDILDIVERALIFSLFSANECKTLPNEENRIYFISLDEVLAAGYSDYCGNCMR